MALFTRFTMDRLCKYSIPSLGYIRNLSTANYYLLEQVTSYLNYKTIISIVIFFYCIYYLNTLEGWHFIDSVDLVIHEAGHVLFSFFGDFLMIAGGTLLQIIIPMVFAGYFFLRGEHFSGSLLLYWLGLNLFNISMYAGDALKMQLPLLTGDKDGHDWNQMLFMVNQIKHTELISNIILGIGVLIILVALFLSIRSSISVEPTDFPQIK